MNLKEIEYIVMIADEKNLTRAAEKLYITPSALTQQVVRLENDLGIQLFLRSRNGWAPTKAGDIYLKAARQMLQLKKDTYKQIQDLAQNKTGVLTVGIPPERGSAMFTSIYPSFHKAYPDIVVNVVEIGVRRQQEMIAGGKLDLGFVTLSDFQKNDDEYILVGREEILVAVPEGHPVCRHAEKTEFSPWPVIDLQELRYEPFAMMNHESTFRENQELVFKQAKIQPEILFETTRANTILDMVAARMCCALVSERYTITAPEGICFFSLPGHPIWNMMACHRKGSYLTEAEKLFIRLARDYWKKN